MYTERNHAFDNLFKKLKTEKNSFYDLPFPKHLFFLFLIEKYDHLLHGSPHCHLDRIEPRRAQCQSKEFGNKNGVYASGNCITPIMFAIATGSIKMHYDFFDNGQYARQDNYWFDTEVYGAENFELTHGMVYILPKNTFSQGQNELGESINEWISHDPVIPLARLEVSRKDFPFPIF